MMNLTVATIAVNHDPLVFSTLIMCCMESTFNMCVYLTLDVVELMSHLAFTFSDLIPETLASILFQKHHYISTLT